MSKFSEIPQFLLNEFISTLDNLQVPITTTNTNAHLGGDTIITKGGKLIELYIDDGTSGYKKIILSYDSVDSDVDNFYFFNKADQLTYEDTYVEYIEEGAYFQIYDAASEEAVVVESDRNVYFRKDSLFHDWLKEGADTVFQDRWYSDFLAENYVNTNEIFTYFGKIYETSTSGFYSIDYQNLPELTKKMLPEHQRTVRMKEFLNLSFGNIFQEIYYKTKDLSSLIDAMTINDDLLNYIVEFTNWSFLDKDVYTLAEREFVRDISLLLKMKGTISSLYLLYKVFSNNSNNRLNIYERWHESTLTGQISASSYYDYLYLHDYLPSVDNTYLDTGAGYVYYQQFFPNFVWSTEATSVTVHANNDTWSVSHNLNSLNITYQTYDQNFKRIIPNTSLLSDENTLILTFESEVSGFCFIKTAIYRKEIDSSYTSTFDTIGSSAYDGSAINHTFGMLVTTENYGADNYSLNPDVIKLRENYIETDMTDGFIVMGEASEKHPSDVTGLVWNIEHTIGKRGVLVDVYGIADEKIFPQEIQIIDENNIQLTLSESLSGYVLITEVGSAPISIDKMLTFNDLILSPSYIVEVDLTTEPMGTDSILTETMSENLITYWEKTRPINNVSNYQLIFSPKSDISGVYFNLYESVSSDVYAKSKLTQDPSYFNVDSSFYYVTAVSNNTSTWVVNHNLETLHVIVNCYDTSNNLIRPDSITYIDSNTLWIDFDGVKINGAVVVTVSDYHDTTSVDSINHNLNDDVIESVSLFGEIYDPENVTLITDDTLEIENIESNSVVQVKGDTTTYSFTDTSVWNIEHNTSYTWFISEFYDLNNERIYPTNLSIIDKFSCIAEFSMAISGYAVLHFIPESISIIDRLENSSITISDTQDSVVTYDYKAEVIEIVEDNNFIYLTAEIPKEDKYTIREIGVIDQVDNVVFATICSDIVKDNNVKMILFYKISKEDLNG